MNEDDESLYAEYKRSVRENLMVKKMDFGPHHRSAFQEVVLREINKLRSENAELKKNWIDAVPDGDLQILWNIVSVNALSSELETMTFRIKAALSLREIELGG